MSDAIREAFEALDQIERMYLKAEALTKLTAVVRAALQQTAPAVPDGGEVEPLGYLTNQAVARLQSDKRLNGEHLYAFKPDDMSKFQAVYLGPAVKESLTAAHPAQPRNEVQAEALEVFEGKLLKAAHPLLKHWAVRLCQSEAARLRSNGGDD